MRPHVANQTLLGLGNYIVSTIIDFILLEYMPARKGPWDQSVSEGFLIIASAFKVYWTFITWTERSRLIYI